MFKWLRKEVTEAPEPHCNIPTHADHEEVIQELQKKNEELTRSYENRKRRKKLDDLGVTTEYSASFAYICYKDNRWCCRESSDQTRIEDVLLAVL